MQAALCCTGDVMSWRNRELKWIYGRLQWHFQVCPAHCITVRGDLNGSGPHSWYKLNTGPLLCTCLLVIQGLSMTGIYTSPSMGSCTSWFTMFTWVWKLWRRWPTFFSPHWTHRCGAELDLYETSEKSFIFMALLRLIFSFLYISFCQWSPFESLASV